MRLAASFQGPVDKSQRSLNAKQTTSQPSYVGSAGGQLESDRAVTEVQSKPLIKSRLQSMPVNALRAFEIASRLGSFQAAAAELSVTPAAVSHRIKSLEHGLGVSLFERLHRSLRLTTAGQQLAKAVQDSFRTIEATLAVLAEDGRLGGPTTLGISAASSVAAKWLAPRLHRFQALYPHIDLRLHAEDRLVDLTQDAGTDVLLRYGPEPEARPDLELVRLWPPGRMVMVCAPTITDRGELLHLADVLKFTLLRTGQPTVSGTGDSAASKRADWAAWLQAAGIEGEARGPIFGSTQLTLEAAMAGEGLALAPEILVAHEIRTGKLAQPFPLSLPNPCSYWLICRTDRVEETKIRAFTKWVLDEAAEKRAS